MRVTASRTRQGGPATLGLLVALAVLAACSGEQGLPPGLGLTDPRNAAVASKDVAAQQIEYTVRAAMLLDEGAVEEAYAEDTFRLDKGKQLLQVQVQATNAADVSALIAFGDFQVQGDELYDIEDEATDAEQSRSRQVDSGQTVEAILMFQVDDDEEIGDLELLVPAAPDAEKISINLG